MLCGSGSELTVQWLAVTGRAALRYAMHSFCALAGTAPLGCGSCFGCGVLHSAAYPRSCWHPEGSVRVAAVHGLLLVGGGQFETLSP